MDGIVAISQRIAGIQAQLTALSPPRPAVATAGTFDRMLDQATGEFAPAQLAPVSTSPPPLSTAPVSTPPVSTSAVSTSAVSTSPVSTSPVSAPPVSAPPAPAAVLNADGVPADLAAYGNGRVPAEALTPIGTTGHRLWAPAAVAFEELLAAATAQGVKIGINDSYRTYQRQVDLVPRLGLYNEGGLAAVPGTSRHGWGMAVDLKLDGQALTWMRANAERFGFVEDTPREPWHWAFYPDRR